MWRHPSYQACLAEIRRCEAGRKFCRHTPEHFLTVARVTCLLAAEQGLPVNQEQVYAAGLLHDIGRHLQYQQNIPHEQAGAEIAEGILIDCGFDRQERSDILRLILCHRSKPAAAEKNTLPALFYRADKLSRNCFFCPAQDECDWPEEKKNREITY
ncbi:MAG: HD domain-containing protein [Oscillospiraceae bacterium]|nr:HD domain-containing protein [Oscillospiraceae bacterium]